MPNSLDEEETQCLLSSEDTITSTFCEDSEDTLEQQNSDSMSLESARMISTLSSNNLYSSDSDFINGTFGGLKSTPSSSMVPNVNTSSPANVSFITTSSTSSKEYVPSDYVIPTLGTC